MGYTRKGTVNPLSLPAPRLAAFHLVLSQYNLPSTFETNRRHGPLSGMTFADRVLAAYAVDGLEAKDGKVAICVTCGMEGHVKKTCPDGL